MDFDTQRWFIAILALGLVLLILGAICMGSAGKSDETNKENCSRSATGVLVISLIIMAVAGFGMWNLYNKQGGKFNLYYY